MKVDAQAIKAQMMWQSPETTPNGDPFLTIKKARGYYYYASRGGIDSIFFILWDKDKNKFGLIEESKPPLDERYNTKVTAITAFGGSMDMGPGITSLMVTSTEVMEETGYVVPYENIQYAGETMVSTQMDQMATGFLVNVTGLVKTMIAEYEASGIGGIIWLSYEELLENSDWKSIFIAAKLRGRYGK